MGARSGGQMARNKLTAIEVKKGDGKLFDGGGLTLKKRAVDSGRWLWRFKKDGRSREMGLDPYPAVSLADARKERDRWEIVLRARRDPIVEREAEKAPAPEAFDPTFQEAAEINSRQNAACCEATRWCCLILPRCAWSPRCLPA